MQMSKQTAVDWLVEQLARKHNEFQALTFYYDHKDEIEQAKQIEKEQTKNAYKDYHDLGHIYGLDAEDYYNAIYGK